MKYVAFSLFCLLPLAAQTSPQPQAKPPAKLPVPAAVEPDDSAPIRLDVTRVSILFTVSDKKGRFVTNLDKEDFAISESKRPQNILEFNKESNLPLRLAVLIDTSNSIRERIRFQQEAATDFVEKVIRAGQDKAMVVSFDTTAEMVSDLTDDKVELGKAIRGLRAGGGTALYDAIYFSCIDKLMQEGPADKYRRALVVLSDGDDNQSHWTREQALEMAHKADVVIYSISTNITHLETDGDKVLKHFAEETGGQAFFPFKAQDLAQDFENIANELRHQYNAFYRPEPLKADGQYHSVEVRVKTHKDLVVRARKGYYAPVMQP